MKIQWFNASGSSSESNEPKNVEFQVRMKNDGHSSKTVQIKIKDGMHGTNSSIMWNVWQISDLTCFFLVDRLQYLTTSHMFTNVEHRMRYKMAYSTRLPSRFSSPSLAHHHKAMIPNCVCDMRF